MKNELYHHGVKGMKWGVRKDKYKKIVNVKKRNVRNKIGTKTGHYSRNKYNSDLPLNGIEAKKRGWERVSDQKTSMHQFNIEDGVKNQKWLSPDGRREVIFSGRGFGQHVNTTPEDEGSYNFFSPNTNPVGHMIVDAIPYVFLGNSEKDNTTFTKRVSKSYEAFRYEAVESLDKSLIHFGEDVARIYEIID